MLYIENLLIENKISPNIRWGLSKEEIMKSVTPLDRKVIDFQNDLEKYNSLNNFDYCKILFVNGKDEKML
jgi:hypothetical protein